MPAMDAHAWRGLIVPNLSAHRKHAISNFCQTKPTSLDFGPTPLVQQKMVILVMFATETGVSGFLVIGFASSDRGSA